MMITPDVTIQLVYPILSSFGRLRNTVVAASFVPMPETTVDENHFAAFAEHEVWPTGQVLCVKAIAVAHSMY